MRVEAILSANNEMQLAGLTGKTYDASTLAVQILNKYPDIRSTVEYEEKKNELIEDTMSCDLGEQRDWMDWFMLHALHRETEAVKQYNGLKTKTQRDWHNTCVNRKLAAVQFIVAYDLKA